jgi:hypothetical protein
MYSPRSQISNQYDEQILQRPQIIIWEANE